MSSFLQRPCYIKMGKILAEMDKTHPSEYFKLGITAVLILRKCPDQGFTRRPNSQVISFSSGHSKYFDDNTFENDWVGGVPFNKDSVKTCPAVYLRTGLEHELIHIFSLKIVQLLFPTKIIWNNSLENEFLVPSIQDCLFPFVSTYIAPSLWIAEYQARVLGIVKTLIAQAICKSLSVEMQDNIRAQVESNALLYHAKVEQWKRNENLDIMRELKSLQDTVNGENNTTLFVDDSELLLRFNFESINPLELRAKVLDRIELMMLAYRTEGVAIFQYVNLFTPSCKKDLFYKVQDSEIRDAFEFLQSLSTTSKILQQYVLNF